MLHTGHWAVRKLKEVNEFAFFLVTFWIFFLLFFLRHILAETDKKCSRIFVLSRKFILVFTSTFDELPANSSLFPYIFPANKIFATGVINTFYRETIPESTVYCMKMRLYKEYKYFNKMFNLCS